MSAPQKLWDEVKIGEVLPALEFEISGRHAIMHVGANRDYMRDHYDLEHARAQGHPNVYVNTLFHQSLVDRIVTDWAGPETFIVRRKLSMLGPMYVGDSVHGSGEVTHLREEINAGYVDLQVMLQTPRGSCSVAVVTIRLRRGTR